MGTGENQNENPYLIQMLQLRLSGLRQLRQEICLQQSILEEERAEKLGYLRAIPRKGRTRTVDAYVMSMEKLWNGREYEEACYGLAKAERLIGQLIMQCMEQLQKLSCL